MAEKSNGVLTIRADEEIKAKFKSLAENLGNQGTALESLLNAYEMQAAKDVLTDRRTDIEDFDAHLQALQSAFLHSLELNENAETRIRQEFQRQLDSKDSIIADLQERIKQAESDADTAKEQATAITSEMAELSEKASNQIHSLNTELQATKKALDTATEQVTDKQSLLDECRKQLEQSQKDSANINELKQRASDAEQECERLKAEIQMIKKQAELDKQTAVLAEQQKSAQQAQQQAEKVQKLYEEIDKLRQEITKMHTEKLVSKKTSKKAE